MIVLFLSIDVLEVFEEDGLHSKQRAEACALITILKYFDFAYNLHLMFSVLGITNELSVTSQKRDQNIVNVMKLVKVSKQQLQVMRDKRWESLLAEVSSFYEKRRIPISNIDDTFVLRRPRRGAPKITNLHYYRVELFYTIIDM